MGKKIKQVIIILVMYGVNLLLFSILYTGRGKNNEDFRKFTKPFGICGTRLAKTGIKWRKTDENPEFIGGK